MLILLPLSVFALLFLNLVALQTGKIPPRSWLVAFLQAAVLWGGYLALSTELLSILNAISIWGVVLVWVMGFFVVAGIGWKWGLILQGLQELRHSIHSLDRFEQLSAIVFVVILAMLFVVAVITPANTSDSLQYHMTRVAHWAQNQSLRHYATGFAPQLVNPIWAEETILNFRILWGDDCLANLVQWFSMVGCLVGVTFLSKLMGAHRKGQIAAAAFAISIPMGLMEATSTQNDLVAAFWLICLICIVVISIIRPLSKDEQICLAITLGLGLLTKGTFYPYAVPVVLWFFIKYLSRFGWLRSFSMGMLITGWVLILNLGYWLRNFMTFGSPLGSVEWIRSMTAGNNNIMTVVSAFVRNLMMNFATPYENLNTQMADWLRSVFGAFDPNLVDFQLIWGWNHNDLAGNPLHVLIVVLTSLLIIMMSRRIRNRLLLQYMLVVGAILLMICLVIKFDPWGIRYQLPFWVAWAPVFGTVIWVLDRRLLTSIAVFGLLAAAMPWVIFNRTRPLIAMRNVEERFTIPCDWHFGCTIGSILVEPKSTVLFANWMELRDDYLKMSMDLFSSGCTNVGLRIDSHDPEYFNWWLLKAPQSGIRIENIYPLPELRAYMDPDFSACAVICTICGEESKILGLPLAEEYGEVRLYLQDTNIPSSSE